MNLNVTFHLQYHDKEKYEDLVDELNAWVPEHAPKGKKSIASAESTKFLDYVGFDCKDPVGWMVAYYLPEMKTVTISSCIDTSQLLKIAYKDQDLKKLVDNTEEHGIIAIALIGFEIVMGVIYGSHRMCKAFKENQRITNYVTQVQRDAILEQARLQSFKMTARVSDALLFFNHIAKRLVKKFLLFVVGLLVTACLFLALSRDVDSTHSDEDDHRFGIGLVSSDFLPPEGQPKLRTFVVVCVLSAPINVQARMAARESWLTLIKRKNPDDDDETGERSAQPLFVVGGRGLEAEAIESLRNEMNLYHDLLILDDLVDSYANLTLKVVHAYAWIHAHLNPLYVVKCDDDSFVRIDLISEELKRPPLSAHRRLYWGFFDGRARPFKKGKWSETSWNLCDLYIPYALGGGYVVSGALVAYVAKNAPDLRLFFNEDVAMGTWMAPLDVDRVHDTRFDTEYKSRGCFSSYLVTHKQSPEMLREKHRNLANTGSICGGPQNEFRSRLSYEYNWSVPPSQCCHRGSDDLP